MELIRPDGSPVRVLVVDDEVNIAELLSMALRYEGWEVRMAHTGSKAVSAAREFQPDAVVLDVMLPGRSGYDILKDLRADPGLAALPVLMLTARGQKKDRELADALGATRFMTKPFSNAEMRQQVRILMEG